MLSPLSKCILGDDNLGLNCITEVKLKNVFRTLSLVEYYINGYNLEAIHVLGENGRGMLYYIKKSI